MRRTQPHPATGHATPAANAAQSAVGERLKAVRAEMRLTLQEVSQRTGVSVSNLSKIERIEVSPSFDVVMRICDGLDIALEQFVKPGPKSNVSGRKTVSRRDEVVRFSSAQYDYFAHATELSRKSMAPLEMRVRARSAAEFDHWSEHGGEEFVYVIAGAIEVHTDQYEPFRLAAGESAYFDSAMKHVYVSVGEGDAHLLSISYSADAIQGSRVEAFLNPAARRIPRQAGGRRKDREKISP